MGVFNILVFILFFGICIASAFGIPVILIYCCAVFFRTATRVSKVEKKLSDILMSGEDVLEKAVQLRPFAFFKRRMLVAITNSRVILISRGLFGGFSMKDFQWKDLQDAVISENVLPNLCGSNLTFNAQQKKLPLQVFQVVQQRQFIQKLKLKSRRGKRSVGFETLKKKGLLLAGLLYIQLQVNPITKHRTTMLYQLLWK